MEARTSVRSHTKVNKRRLIAEILNNRFCFASVSSRVKGEHGRVDTPVFRALGG